jgi:hypothetical protein
MAWTETYAGGDPVKELEEFKQLADDIMHAQLKARRAAVSGTAITAVDRAFHVKPLLATDNAELHFYANLPPELSAGYAQPDARYPVTVRISNAANRPGSDSDPDMRGIALRVRVSETERHDLLATNYPVSHARNARQFVNFAVATAGGTVSRVFGIGGLLFSEGPAETVRMLKNVKEARRKIDSVALETYWSRGAMRWGPTLAVRFLIRPLNAAPVAGNFTGADSLSQEIASRLANGPVQVELAIQRYVDDRRTPIEDTSIAWEPGVARIEPIATLTIPQQNVATPMAGQASRTIDALAFNPWNTTDEFRPLGNLNRARKNVYDASAAHRLQMRWRAEPPLRNRIASKGAAGLYTLINRRYEWYQLPLVYSLLNLDISRAVLRRENLIDTEPPEAPPKARPVPTPPLEEHRATRTFDGQWNDLSAPKMGAVGATFGRNLKPDFAQSVDEPHPYVVARALLDRKTFLPARSLNLLAAAWIQFQVHDWVNHARFRLGQDGGKHDIRIPLPQSAPDWSNTKDGPLEREMRIAGNIQNDETGHLFGNAASHWWDSSEVYGADAQAAAALREGAKIRLHDGFLPVDTSGRVITGFNESWWLGLGALHLLFVREHNLLCDELRAHYPSWSDDRIFHTARLIVSALIAKIHTVEWTPAILATRAIDVALNANWSGPPADDWKTKFGIWLTDVHAATGIPKTKPDHHGAPYALTEDFATVYRLHPLLPDEYAFYHYRNGASLGTAGFLDIHGDKADAKMRQLRLHNCLYSMGIAHPGAITLHNYPRSLQGFVRDDGSNERIDLSVIDIVRTRRRGVPRYNAFRTGLHKRPVTRWEEMCADPESVRIMRELYHDDINKVDTMIGLFAEPCPQGFGFSDTAFRIFLLMATRRIQSDRFLTVDFRPEIYSPFGMDWIANNGMTGVILRHCPELAAMVPRDASAFAPWRLVARPT